MFISTVAAFDSSTILVNLAPLPGTVLSLITSNITVVGSMDAQAGMYKQLNMQGSMRRATGKHWN